ncbi:MAG: low molecular weight phosphotyrosine protein phosphatase [Erysipelotrichaceae bacterium]|nr:low molecular weight phosphotyrosine protein phosphatase [Erysipelotrichaceae bacterium]
MPKRIMFVCLGNICRSPMAKFMFLERIRKLHLEDLFEVSSAGISDEASGGDLYPPAKDVLRRNGIPFSRHRARRLRKNEYDDYDLFYAMDSDNFRFLKRMFRNDPENKVRRMLEERDVADPWWTGDFNRAYSDIDEGITRILKEVTDAEI